LIIAFASDIRRRDISGVADWTSVLRLATRFKFPAFRELALDELDTLASSLEKLALGRELDIAHWILPAQTSICLQQEPLSLSDAARLPLPDVVLIYTVRERMQTARATMTSEDVTRYIRSLASDPTSSLPLPVDSEYALITPPDSSEIQNPSPSTAAFDPEELSSALRDSKYERAVTCLSAQHLAEASRTIVRYFNAKSSGPLHGVHGVPDFIIALFRRSAHDGTFSAFAAKLIGTLKKEVCADEIFIQQIVEEAALSVLTSSPWQARFNPKSTAGRIVYSSDERWVPDDEFTNRANNATILVGELLRAAELSPASVFEVLSPPLTVIGVIGLHHRLAVLGPILDASDATRAKLDGLIKKVDERIQLDVAERMWYTVSEPANRASCGI
jgi:hypothetical protein